MARYLTVGENGTKFPAAPDRVFRRQRGISRLGEKGVDCRTVETAHKQADGRILYMAGYANRRRRT